MKNSQINLFVPGRLCLFGEHSDWAGAQRAFNANIIPGEAVVTGVEQGIYAVASRHDNFVMGSSIPGEEDLRMECEMSVPKLREIAKDGAYFSYVAGVASYICEHYHVGGVDIRIMQSTLPVKRGLSSSAAICVLVAKAFNKLYDLQMSVLGEMQVAYFGEQRTPSRCGRLDQACAFGIRPVHMVFDGADISAEGLMPKKELHFVFADLMASKDTVKILADLNRGFPFPQTDIDFKLHQALGKDNHDIVSRAVKYIEEGDAPALGALMTQAQQLFDEKVAPACPEQLTSPVLHQTLKDRQIAELTYGGKGVGSQGDGTVQFLARDRDCQEKLVSYLRDELHMDPYELTILPQKRITRAIIPVAGFGMRLYPATRLIRKEFFPVVDVDGFAKPAILILLEELERAGIEKFCLVIGGDEDRKLYDEFFSQQFAEEYIQNIPVKARAFESIIKRLGEKIEFVVQEEKLGFGHAVYQCKKFAGDQPVLLALGDTLYRSDSPNNCTEQLLAAFEKTNTTTVSIHPINLDDVIHYGVLTGEWVNAEKSLMQINEFVEKPSVEYASEFLSVPFDHHTSRHYAIFGEYILMPEVFDVLHEHIENGRFCGGEIQLTQALSEVRNKQGLYGFVVDGRAYDIGIPKAYMQTNHEFSKTADNE